MTQEIIEMARQAGFNPQSLFMKSKLEAFAKLVEQAAASKERERLAQEAHECGGVLTVGAILSKG
jgi:hypothetical protein